MERTSESKARALPPHTSRCFPRGVWRVCVCVCVSALVMSEMRAADRGQHFLPMYAPGWLSKPLRPPEPTKTGLPKNQQDFSLCVITGSGAMHALISVLDLDICLYRLSFIQVMTFLKGKINSSWTYFFKKSAWADNRLYLLNGFVS